MTGAILSFLLLLPGCGAKQQSPSSLRVHTTIPLFIEMPQNPLVFEDLSPLIYDELWSHYKRAGYVLAHDKKDSYCLRVTITHLDEIGKLVSPDVLTYGYKVKLSLACQLFDPHNDLLGAHTFRFYKWVYKPKSPILDPHYLHAYYRSLLAYSVPKIDYYFRRYFPNKKIS